MVPALQTTFRVMEREDISAAAAMMAKAFQNAALYRYFEDDDVKRPAFLRMIFQRRIEAGFDTQRGELAFEHDTLIGAAIWRAPGASSPPDEILTDLVRRYDSAVCARWEHFHALLFDMLGAACPAPHWSLAPIAVLPEAQGRGVGGALIRRQFAVIDKSGAPCLLGTQDEVNTRIYARYGFTIAGKVLLRAETQNAPALFCYAMVR